MAPITTELATLRALSFRISSTPTAQLPQHVPAIAASLANCRTLLASTQPSGSKFSSSEASLAVHKYRTLLSTLLQDRTIQGRWAAIVLIKATVEIGGWETLQKCLPWVRGLLGFLSKPDPPSSKRLCIITLTRIFILTKEYPTLVREITTPSLPAFVQVSLQIANSSVPATLLQTVLESLNELLPRHPTVFRSHLKQIHPLLVRLIAPTPSTKLSQEQEFISRVALPSGVTNAARQLHVQLPCCALKGALSEEWGKALKIAINNTHKTADKVFRAVLEDWQAATREVSSSNGHTLDGEVQSLEPDSMGLLPWSGIYAGSERLIGLLRLVKEYLENGTANSVYLNVGMIADLISRILSLTAPTSGGKSFQNTTRLNNQVSKEERESLWLLLPDVHVAAIEVLLALTNRSQTSTLALDALVIDQLVWVFGAEKETAKIRTACYLAVATTLQRSGVAFPKSTIDSIVPLMRACCDDLVSPETIADSVKQTPGQAKANGNSQPQITANADTFLTSSKSASNPIAGFLGLREASYDLLPVLFAHIRAQYFSDSMRARLDRTAILVQHKDAMVASVLNPPPSKKFGKPAASILPLMARSFPHDKDIEGMLRPRVPVIRLGTQDLDSREDTEEMDADEEAEELEVEQEQETAKEEPDFTGQELETLLASEVQPQLTVNDLAMTNASIMEAVIQDTIAQDVATAQVPSPSTEAAKRSLGDEASSPLSKRVKPNEQELGAAFTIPYVPAAASLNILEKSSSALFTSGSTAATTASTIPELPRADDAISGNLDSDEDDAGSLVLGQDSDDESE